MSVVTNVSEKYELSIPTSVRPSSPLAPLSPSSWCLMRSAVDGPPPPPHPRPPPLRPPRVLVRDPSALFVAVTDDLPFLALALRLSDPLDGLRLFVRPAPLWSSSKPLGRPRSSSSSPSSPSPPPPPRSRPHPHPLLCLLWHCVVLRTDPHKVVININVTITPPPADTTAHVEAAETVYTPEIEMIDAVPDEPPEGDIEMGEPDERCRVGRGVQCRQTDKVVDRQRLRYPPPCPWPPSPGPAVRENIISRLESNSRSPSSRSKQQ